MSNVIIFIFTWLYLCSHLHVSPVTLFFTWFYLCSHLHVSPVHFFFYLALPLLSPACVTCLLSFLPGFTCTFTCMCHLFTFCFYLVLPLLLPACVTCLLSFFTWIYLYFHLHVSPVYFLFLPGFTFAFTCMCHLFTFSFYQALPLLLPACATCLLSFFLPGSTFALTCTCHLFTFFFTWLYLYFHLHVSPVYFLFLTRFTFTFTCTCHLFLSFYTPRKQSSGGI